MLDDCLRVAHRLLSDDARLVLHALPRRQALGLPSVLTAPFCESSSAGKEGPSRLVEGSSGLIDDSSAPDEGSSELVEGSWGLMDGSSAPDEGSTGLVAGL